VDKIIFGVLFFGIWILYYFSRGDVFIRRISPLVGLLGILSYLLSKFSTISYLKGIFGPLPIVPFLWLVIDPFFPVDHRFVLSSSLFLWGIYLILRGQAFGLLPILFSLVPLIPLLIPMVKDLRWRTEKKEKTEEKVKEKAEDVEKDREDGEELLDKLSEFGIRGKIVKVSKGPVLTVYEFEPAPGVRVQSISKLEDDLYVRLKKPVRIVAPLPNGNIGFEIPNDKRIFYNLEDFEDEIIKGAPLRYP
jgi:DNA segregation ATPase FtsK/SpoIIIE and related proteins